MYNHVIKCNELQTFSYIVNTNTNINNLYFIMITCILKLKTSNQIDFCQQNTKHYNNIFNIKTITMLLFL